MSNHPLIFKNPMIDEERTLLGFTLLESGNAPIVEGLGFFYPSFGDWIIDNWLKALFWIIVIAIAGSILVFQGFRGALWKGISLVLPSNRQQLTKLQIALDNFSLGASQPRPREANLDRERLERAYESIKNERDGLQREYDQASRRHTKLEEERALLPDAKRQQQEITGTVVDLGERLRNVVAEMVAEQQLANPDE